MKKTLGHLTARLLESGSDGKRMKSVGNLDELFTHRRRSSVADAILPTDYRLEPTGEDVRLVVELAAAHGAGLRERKMRLPSMPSDETHFGSGGDKGSRTPDLLNAIG